MAGFADLSIVVPLAPGDPAWKGMIAELAARAELAACEIVFSGPEEPGGFGEAARSIGARWVSCSRGRARQLNAGARACSRPWLWFVHADTRLTESALPRLRDALAAEGEGIRFFDLLFYDAPALMWINTAGVRLRSRMLRAPYGDQAFLMGRQVFERLGGFPEDAAYGEDHLLVWRAHQSGIPLRAIGASVRTSGRKYVEHGWARVTWRHGQLFLGQAWPELLRWIGSPGRSK